MFRYSLPAIDRYFLFAAEKRLPNLCEEWKALFEKISKFRSDLRQPRSSLAFAFVEVMTKARVHACLCLHDTSTNKLYVHRCVHTSMQYLLCLKESCATVVLEIFAGIKYCISAYFNDIQKKL